MTVIPDKRHLLTSRKHQTQRGIGQLTIVEHSLCPLDPRLSLVQNLVHSAEYQFSDAKRRRQTAKARVLCPLGLSANDEFYLWGLLALTLSLRTESSEFDGELRATPHWCLRQLGIVDARSRRGGRQYRQFADAVRRLSTVSYLNDQFYDPVRAEHRQVSFRFFSYSLPVDPDSSRAWRIVWDPIFFEMVTAAAGQFRFDLATYRQLDTASRRWFLFLSKVFSRRRRCPSWDLEELAVGVLGFSSSLSAADMKVKVNRCIVKLRSLQVVESAEYTKVARGEYRLQLTPGAYFSERRHRDTTADLADVPVWEALAQIGFEPASAKRLIGRFPMRLLEEWADITLAARERHGDKFFRKSAMAFLVDSVTAAAAGTRTAPDWWHELRKREKNTADMSAESLRVFERIRDELFDSSVEGADVQGFATAGRILSKQPN